MVGMALKLGGTVASSPFGKLREYEGTNAGTIFLWDANWQNDGAVPGHDSAVTNLVRKQGAAITGLTEAQMDATAQNNTGPYLAVERTSKGGIHAAYSQAGGHAAGAAAFALIPSAALREWIYNNSDAGADYAFMVSLWFRRTRDAAAATNQALSGFTSAASATANFLFHAQNAQAFSGAPVGQNQNAFASALGVPAMVSLATQGWAGARPATAAGVGYAMIANSGPNGPWTSLSLNKASSNVLYRAQIDVLNLADVAGADNAAKQATIMADLNAMLARDFAAGGRLSNDVYTPAANLKQ